MLGDRGRVAAHPRSGTRPPTILTGSAARAAKVLPAASMTSFAPMPPPLRSNRRPTRCKVWKSADPLADRVARTQEARTRGTKRRRYERLSQVGHAQGLGLGVAAPPRMLGISTACDSEAPPRRLLPRAGGHQHVAHRHLADQPSALVDQQDRVVAVFERAGQRLPGQLVDRRSGG